MAKGKAAKSESGASMSQYDVEVGTLENGKPDFRIQKMDKYSPRWKDMYLCDNGMQLTYAMEDFEYTKWLDPAGVPCYTKDEARSYE